MCYQGADWASFIKVGRYTGILSYSQYLFDTGIAVLVFMLYWYAVIGGISYNTPIL